MGQVTAWRCEETGKLFLDENKYAEHLQRLEERKRVSKCIKNLPRINEMLSQAVEFSDIIKIIQEQWTLFFDNGAVRSMWKYNTVPEKHTLCAINLYSMKWNDRVPNSHSCPRGGVTNFGDHENQITSYPGWEGMIHLRVSSAPLRHKNKNYHNSGFGSAYFSDTIINTGTGGGGGLDSDISEYQYSVKLFAADFPKMYERHVRWQWVENENRNREIMWRRLGGAGDPPLVYEAPADLIIPDPLTGMEE